MPAMVANLWVPLVVTMVILLPPVSAMNKLPDDRGGRGVGEQ